MTNQKKILLAINNAPTGLSAAEIQRSTGICSGSLYADLIDLEAKEALQSYWIDGPYPRRKLYRLPT